MCRLHAKISKNCRAIAPHVASFASDRRGNLSVMMGLTLPMLLGGFGIGMETRYWELTRSAIQNAADAAVIAAAANGGANFAAEAKAVAAQYGLQDGNNNVTIGVSNTAACPGGGNNCYSVTITAAVPLFLTQVVGYTGNATANGAPAVSFTTTAIATQGAQQVQYCVLALAGSGQPGITSNGSPFADLSGCSIMSNTSATCHGSNLKADVGSAHGANSNCGLTKYSNVPTVSDPYSGYAANIPADRCAGNYPQEPGRHGSPLPPSNLWSGTQSLSGNVVVCGDLQLTGNVTVNTPASGGVLVIVNGQLDTNGFTLQTSSGSGLTVVFTGTNSATYTHAPTGGGTLDIAAPTTGPWKGVAIYQDPSLSIGVDIWAAGNSPTWNITGLVYLPNSSVTFSGAVNKSSNGQSCFALVVDNVTFNGTGDILANGGCAAAGLNLPTGSIPARGKLVG
jgi:Flp pilus assembly protein TadG